MIIIIFKNEIDPKLYPTCFEFEEQLIIYLYSRDGLKRVYIHTYINGLKSFIQITITHSYKTKIASNYWSAIWQ